MEPLKLAALDSEDLEILSAHVQDAVMRVGDFNYRPKEQRLLIVLNRFDWQAASGAPGKRRRRGARYVRRRAALRFDRVTGVKAQKIRQDAADAVLNLLAIQFEETTPPGGHVTLVFSGGAALRLEVECIEAELSDLGAAWEAEALPEHQDDPG